jgi:hypothetical protein
MTEKRIYQATFAALGLLAAFFFFWLLAVKQPPSQTIDAFFRTFR